MVMEELVEKLRDTILGIAECSEGGIVNSEAIARSVLSCIEEEGMVVVPREPTEEMLEVLRKQGGIDGYEAMLAAAPNPSPSSASA
jgi:hypothetical protein